MTASPWLDDAPPADREDEDQLWAATMAVQPTTASGEGPKLLRRHSLGDLLDMPDDFAWLSRGLLSHPTYGQIAGELKTLKSTIAQIVANGVTTGRPIFDHFTVDQPGPVLQYVGEGGRMLWTRRQRRIAAAMGVDSRDIDNMHVVFDVAPIQSPAFAQSFARDLRDVQPRLVILDPLYAYHGTATNAARLHEEGALLTSLSQPAVEAGATLQVVNHFNQTGSGDGLKRITMAGSGEWVDSWLLTSHREPPDVAHGRFRLRLDVGSRQWGGARYDLDIDLGAFDPVTGAYDSDITWSLDASSASRDEVSKRTQILDLVAAEPWRYTRTQLVDAVGGNADAVRVVLDTLTQHGDVVFVTARALEGSRQVSRQRAGLPTQPRLGTETDKTELPS